MYGKKKGNQGNVIQGKAVRERKAKKNEGKKHGGKLTQVQFNKTLGEEKCFAESKVKRNIDMLKVRFTANDFDVGYKT